MENKFIDGFYVDNPNEKAPDFVKGKISINAKFIEWYEANKNEKGYVNIDILESREGKLYGKHNDFKPSGSSVPQQSNDLDDLPF